MMDSQNIRFRNVAFDTTSTWGVGVAVSLVASGMDALTNNDLLLLAHGLSHARSQRIERIILIKK